jgi:hypothetical protein
MTLTASRHHKRSIALTMLLVWVFALLSGVANACLTEPRGELQHADIAGLAGSPSGASRGATPRGGSSAARRAPRQGAVPEVAATRRRRHC